MNKKDIEVVLLSEQFKKVLLNSTSDVELDMTFVMENSPELFGVLMDNSNCEEVLSLLNEIITGINKSKRTVRLVNLPPMLNIPIRDIRAKHLNHLVVVDGIIRQATDVRPFLIRTKQECNNCGTIITINEKTRVNKRLRCSCNGSTFHEISKQYIDHQKIVIEETPDSLDSSGTQPKRLAIILEDGLVDKKFDKRTIPGNKVQIVGILKEVDMMSNGKTTNKKDIFIEANNIISTERDSNEILIDDKDIEQFKELSQQKGLLDKLAESLAPSVFGHEQIKRAITLQLFGGVRKKKSDNTFTRGDIHLLLCGEPGTAKSVLLRNAVNLIPKARFVSGKSATGAGLVGAAVKDELAGHWLIEAGAIVLANKSLLACDEFEKMGEQDRAMMHEALESQVVSFAKAGIQATLNTQTCLLAAANPKYGRFRSEMVLEDINLPPSLLSRFDCIFVIRDSISKQKDELIAERILEEQSEVSSEGLINQEFLKKYISYSKKINPSLTKEASDMIKNFYVQIRDMGKEKNIVQMGARQLEAMIRLSQAHARLRLSDKVEKQDAEVAIELLTDSLKHLGYKQNDGFMDIDVLQKIPKSKKQKVETLLELLRKNKNLGNNKMHYKDVEKLTEGILDSEEVWMLLKTLVNAGDLYEPKLGFFALID